MQLVFGAALLLAGQKIPSNNVTEANATKNYCGTSWAGANRACKVSDEQYLAMRPDHACDHNIRRHAAPTPIA